MKLNTPPVETVRNGGRGILLLYSVLILSTFGLLAHPSSAEAALTVTTLETHVAGGSPVQTTTDTFTPADNSLIVVVVSAICPGGCGTNTISGGGLNWTQWVEEENENSWSSVVYIYTAQATTGASMSVTHTTGASTDASGGQGITVLQVTGHNTVSPIRQVFTDGAASGRSNNYTGNFSTTTLSSSYVISTLAADNDSASLNQQAPGTGWSSLHEALYGSYGATLAQSRTASTSVRVHYSDFDAGYSWSIGAVEIAEAAITYARVQVATSTFADPASVTLSSTPVEGNLLVTLAGERAGTDPNLATISGSGWTKIIADDTQPADGNARRSQVVWYKVAGASEPTTITVDDGTANSKMILVQEFTNAIPDGSSWMLQATTSGNSGTGSASPISSGSTASVPAGEQLLIGTAIWRREGSNAFSNPAFTGLAQTVSLVGGSDQIVAGSAYATSTAAGIKSTSLSWTGTGHEGNAGLIVFTSEATNPAGTVLLGEHVEGQASNIFSFQNETDATIFAFSLDPELETTVSAVTLRATGVSDNVSTTSVPDLRLHRDIDDDGELDGGDVQVSTGSFTIFGTTGTIVFNQSFIASTSENFIITSDTNDIDKQEALTLWLYAADVTTAATVSGAVSAVQHQRYTGNGGGSSASVGGAPPAGQGIQTGGSSGGGTSADEGVVGDNIAPNPNFFQPTAQSGSWTNGTNALVSDGSRAEAPGTVPHVFSGFGFNIPSGNSIQGIEVKLDSRYSNSAGAIAVDLSWNDGGNYTSTKSTPALTASDVVYTLGGRTDTWGRSWSSSELANAAFRVRVTAGVANLQLDGIEVRVYHQAEGGGGGGGGGI